jgi:hypothetical protein
LTLPSAQSLEPEAFAVEGAEEGSKVGRRWASEDSPSNDDGIATTARPLPSALTEEDTNWPERLKPHAFGRYNRVARFSHFVAGSD